MFVRCAAVAGAGAALAGVPALWALAFLSLVVAAPLLVHEGLAPRTVTATADRLEVRARWRRRHVRWDRLRRTRPVGSASWLVGGDPLVERDDGHVVRLPPELRGGTVARWREQVGAGRPDDVLPQTWRRYDPGRRTLFVAGSCLLLQLGLRVVDPGCATSGPPPSVGIADILRARTDPQGRVSRQALGGPHLENPRGPCERRTVTGHICGHGAGSIVRPASRRWAFTSCATDGPTGSRGKSTAWTAW